VAAESPNSYSADYPAKAYKTGYSLLGGWLALTLFIMVMFHFSRIPHPPAMSVAQCKLEIDRGNVKQLSDAILHSPLDRVNGYLPRGIRLRFLKRYTFLVALVGKPGQTQSGTFEIVDNQRETEGLYSYAVARQVPVVTHCWVAD
jgi:hypothetical protein